VEHIGIDVHKRESQLCIVTEQGEVIEQRIRSERGRFAEVLGGRARAKILVEASTESEWVSRCLEEMGHEVVVADPNFAPMYGMRSRRVKTDRRDARALADACMTGTYRKAHRTSEGRRQLKAQLAVREAMVRERAKHISLIGALVRQQGLRVATGSADSFLSRLTKVGLAEEVKKVVAPLVAVMRTLNEQIQVADAKLERLATEDEQVARLCTMPSVGPVTAAAFVASVDDAKRFAGPHQLEAYLGLVPSERSSGEKQRKGRITKVGSPRMRALLAQVALSTMRLRKATTAVLWEWANRIEVRRGRKVAAVALARKVAGILYAMMRDGTNFKPWVKKQAMTAV
jgi:transposase